MSKSKFKLGDRVRLANNLQAKYKDIGDKIGIITRTTYHNSRKKYTVVFDIGQCISKSIEFNAYSYQLQSASKNKWDLMKSWNDICNKYLKAFCVKHDYKYEPDWIGGDVGTIIEISDMFVNMDDIRYDVDNNIPEYKFANWYWKHLEVYELTGEYYLNYKSYCKGAPDEWTEERMNKIRENKKYIDRIKKELLSNVE